MSEQTASDIVLTIQRWGEEDVQIPTSMAIFMTPGGNIMVTYGEPFEAMAEQNNVPLQSVIDSAKEQSIQSVASWCQKGLGVLQICAVGPDYVNIAFV